MGSERVVVLMFAVPRPPQRLRVQNEVGHEGPAALGHVVCSVVSGSPVMALSSTLASGTLPSVRGPAAPDPTRWLREARDVVAAKAEHLDRVCVDAMARTEPPDRLRGRVGRAATRSRTLPRSRCRCTPMMSSTLLVTAPSYRANAAPPCCRPSIRCRWTRRCLTHIVQQRPLAVPSEVVERLQLV